MADAKRVELSHRFTVPEIADTLRQTESSKAPSPNKLNVGLL